MSEFIKAVTAAEFEQEVLQKSQSIPILIDFWADWCAPCKQLMPVLHQIVDSLKGAVHLATIDTEAEQELAVSYGIRSLPTVLLMKNGEIVEQFMGVQSESEIRKILAPHLAQDDNNNSSQNSDNLQKAMALINQGQVLDAIPYLAEDSSLQGRLLLVKIYLQEGKIEKAITLFDTLSAEDKSDAQAQIIKTTIELIQLAEHSTNKFLQDAIEHTIAINPHEGIEQLLALLAKAQSEEKNEIKKSLIVAFNLINDPVLVSQLRRKMAALIF